MKKSTIIILVIAALIIIWGFVSYNGLVRANESVDNQWAQVETQYQRRYDLVPNLVAAVKGILKQEQTVFGDIAAARTQYAGAKTTDEKVSAANSLESGIGRLLVIVENYPQLKSSENIQTLMAQLEGTENRISVERQRFNDMVQAYNLKTKTFPSTIMASIFGFHERAYFEADKSAATAPAVNLQ